MIRPDLHLSPSFLAWLAPYLAAFSRRTRPTVEALAVGALLAVGPRTVTNCLRALGLTEHPSFTAFHRVLNRNAWSGLTLARTLLRAVVAAFVPSGPIVIGGVLVHFDCLNAGRMLFPLFGLDCTDTNGPVL